MTHEPTSRQLAGAMRWALDSTTNPAMAAADWLASDIRPDCTSAVALLTEPETSLADLRKAKNAFKTLRIVGETREDRHVGARFYAASIAAALVHHDQQISRQSDEALHRGFLALADDRVTPEGLREIARRALCTLEQRMPYRVQPPSADGSDRR